MTVANGYVCGQIQLRDRANDGQIHLRADRYLTVADRSDIRLAFKLMTHILLASHSCDHDIRKESLDKSDQISPYRLPIYPSSSSSS